MPAHAPTIKTSWSGDAALPPYPRHSLEDWLNEMSFNAPVRHGKLYLEGGDVVFQVENRLLRLHSYFFTRESAFFRELLLESCGIGGELQVRRSSDSQPFVLRDVTEHEFASLCWIFYNPKHTVYEAAAERWIMILRLASDWGFAEATALAVRELEQLTLPPVDKIALYTRHGVDAALLAGAFAALARRAEPLTPAEGEQLGFNTFARIAHAREIVRGAGAPLRVDTNMDVETDANEMSAILEKVGLSPLRLDTGAGAAAGPRTAPAGSSGRRPYDTVPSTPLASIPETPDAPPSYDGRSGTAAAKQRSPQQGSYLGGGAGSMRRTNSLGFGVGNSAGSVWTGQAGRR